MTTSSNRSEQYPPPLWHDDADRPNFIPPHCRTLTLTTSHFYERVKEKAQQFTLSSQIFPDFTQPILLKQPLNIVNSR
jgi:hypothetical protein